MYVCMHVYLYVWMHVCMYVCLYVCIYIYTSIYIYIRIINLKYTSDFVIFGLFLCFGIPQPQAGLKPRI